MVYPVSKFRTCLLFAGVERPPSWHSPWWMCYVLWRLLVVIGTVSIVYNIIWFRNKKSFITPYYLLPALLSTLAAGYCWVWLPGVIKALLAEDTKGYVITRRDTQRATSIFTKFVAGCFVTGVGMAIARLLATGSWSIFFLVFILECGTSVVLATVLLALTIETLLAQKDLNRLVFEAHNKSLTANMYVSAKQMIHKRSKRWIRPLDTLALVALYCTVSLVVCHLHFYTDEGEVATNLFTEHDDDIVSGIEINIEVTTVLAKESILLLIMMVLVMDVNDTADSLVTILMETAPWGAPGGAEEAQRLDLVQRMTVYAVRPIALKGWSAYFRTDKMKPIHFNICHLRITRDFVLAAVASFFLAVLNYPIREALKSADVGG